MDYTNLFRTISRDKPSLFLVTTGAALVGGLLLLKRRSKPEHSITSDALPPKWIQAVAEFLYRRTTSVLDTLMPPQVKLMRLSLGFGYSKLLLAAVDLGIADLLKNGPMSPADLARLSGAQEDLLRRALRALCQIGIFVENRDGTFANNRDSEFLRKDHPESAAPSIGHWGDESYRSWTHLTENIKTGKSGVSIEYGKTVWDLYKDSPEMGSRFSKTMTAVQALTTHPIVDEYSSNWHSFSTIVDVGGSMGTLLSSILLASPNSKGILFDLPEVVERAKTEGCWVNTPFENDLAQRITLHPGNFFESVPSADAYVLRMILHDWSDNDSIKILSTIRKSIPQNGKLLICDQVVPGRGEVVDNMVHNLLIDIQMMAVCELGKERSREEFRILLQASGFQLTRVINTKSMLSIVEAVPI